MTQISIHRALSIVSKANDGLRSQIQAGIFVGTVQGIEGRPTDRSFKNELELTTRIQSDTDKIEGNLALIGKIKAAIMAKNLETFVSFDGRRVSITELLAIKSTLPLRKEYVNRLRVQLMAGNNLADRAQQEILTSIKNDSSITDPVSQQRRLEDLSGIRLITGNSESVAEKIKKLEEQNEFLADEIDTILSETNLSTMIELD